MCVKLQSVVCCEAAECCVCEAAECCVCEAPGVLLVCSVGGAGYS